MTEDPAERRGSVGGAVALIALGLIVPAAGIAIAYRSCDQPTARGQIAVTGVAGASWRQPLFTCWMPPGVLDQVDLGRDDQVLMHVALVADGKLAVELTPPTGGPPLRIDAAMCPLTLKPARLDDWRSGSLFTHCELPGGGKVSIDAWWRRCAPREEELR